MKIVDEVEVFEYLDDLRESGDTNMFGATSYIQEEFDLDSIQAKKLLLKWMKTFDERHSQTKQS